MDANSKNNAAENVAAPAANDNQESSASAPPKEGRLTGEAKLKLVSDAIDKLDAEPTPEEKEEFERTKTELRDLAEKHDEVGWKLGRKAREVLKRHDLGKFGYSSPRDFFTREVSRVEYSTILKYVAVAEKYTEEEVLRDGMMKLYLRITHHGVVNGEDTPMDPEKEQFQVPQEDGSVATKRFDECSKDDLESAVRYAKAQKSGRSPSQKPAPTKTEAPSTTPSDGPPLQALTTPLEGKVGEITRAIDAAAQKVATAKALGTQISGSLKQGVQGVGRVFGQHKKALIIGTIAFVVLGAAGGVVSRFIQGSFRVPAATKSIRPQPIPREPPKAIEPTREPQPAPVPVQQKQDVPKPAPVEVKKVEKPEPAPVKERAEAPKKPVSTRVPSHVQPKAPSTPIAPALLDAAEKLYLQAYTERQYDPADAKTKLERVIKWIPAGQEIRTKAERLLSEIDRQQAAPH